MNIFKKFMLTSACIMLLTSIANGKPITREQARQKALAFQILRGDTRQVKAVTSEKRLAPRKGAATHQEPYFVFERGDDEGFLIVSGDDATIDVLGYCDKGTFDYEQLPPGLQDMLTDYASQIEAIQSGAPVLKMPANHPKVEQLMTSTWSQGYPYNLKCPLDNGNRSVTGCVATAIAQLLYYNRDKSVDETTATIPSFNTRGKGIHVDAIPAGSPIDWANMKDSYSSATDLQRQAVADLMLYCGAAVQMDYTSSSSGAYSSDAYKAFINYFGYGSSVRFVTYQDVTTDDGWDAVAYGEISAGRPFYVSGSNGSGGHAFVCDGYESQRYHINWGWGGKSDGYYYFSNLTPGDGQGTGGSDSGYNGGKQIVIGLEPENYENKVMRFADTTVSEICLNNFDADDNGLLTYGEIAAVTALGSVFKDTNIKTFNELYYFTGITDLSDDAFNGCESLNTLRLPKKLKSLGARAFKGCVSLRQINLPTGINHIGEEAFCGCNIMNAIELTSQMTAIEKATFKGCNQLTTIDLPISISSIGNEAFADCRNLREFYVHTYSPSEISMGSGIFDNIDLTGATLHVMQGTKTYFETTDQWKTFGNISQTRDISGGHFTNIEAGKSYYIYNVGTGRYLTNGEAYGTQAVVGTSPMLFKAVRTNAMANGLYYFTNESGGYLFRTTEDTNVGTGVKAVFVDGTELKATTCYWNVQAVKDNVYTIQLPSNFSGYTAGEYLGIQSDHTSNAASPSYGAYYDIEYANNQKGCQWQFVAYDKDFTENYLQAEVLGNLVSMAKKERKNCDQEQAIYLNLESTTEEIINAQNSLRSKLSLIIFTDSEARKACLSLYDTDTNGELSYEEASDVKDLGYEFYFNNNTAMKSFNELRYFKNAYRIPSWAFINCTNLESVILPDGIEIIEEKAFQNCKRLGAINLPSHVSTIGDYAFDGCTALKEVTIEAEDPQSVSIGTGAFNNVPISMCTLYVPFGTKALYEKANIWKNFGHIIEVRGSHTQPKFSPITADKTGYLYNIGTRKYVTMGEAYGTQSVVALSGRVYKLKRTLLSGKECYYFLDAKANDERVIFRTNTDKKVGEGVAACFGDGSLSTKAYWTLTPYDAGENIFTLQVPESDTLYAEGEYLGTDKNHATNYTYSGTSGIYWDISGITDNALWAFVSEEDMAQANKYDNVVAQLKEMLATAREKMFNVDDEQAVYDNAESTYVDLLAALKSVREKLRIITFSDETAETICLKNWDADADGNLTFDEAAAVTNLGETFRGASTMKYFEELKYFTGLTAISDNAFRSSSQLVTLFIPKNVKTIGAYAFTACSLLRNLVILNDSEMIPFGSCSLSNKATVFLPQQMLATYQTDEKWSTNVKRLTEYTGKPIVTAEATRIYGRTTGTITTVVLGAPVEGDPTTECDLLKVGTTPVGTYPIIVNQGTIITPGVNLQEGVLTITPAPLTITAKSYTRNVGEQNPEFELTYNRFRNKETDTVFTVRPVITCDATISSPAGEYEIRVSGAEAHNYDITYVNGTLTIIAPTGITEHHQESSNKKMFDLQGRRVNKATRGIYIINRKKVVVK